MDDTLLQEQQAPGAPLSDDLTRASEPLAPLGTSEKAPSLAHELKAAVQIGVDRILDAFEHKLAYDEAKQRQIDQLHAELQRHRSALLARTTRPLTHGMIQLHDNIGKLLLSLREKPTEALTAERFFTLLEGLQGDIEILLEQNGTSAYRVPGGAFDPHRQRVLRRIATTDPALAERVAESIRPGFEQGTEVLEKERVATYVLTREPPSTSEQPVPPLDESHAPRTPVNDTEN